MEVLMAYQYVRADQGSEYAGDVILTNTNKVGIGTTGPLATMHLAGSNFTWAVQSTGQQVIGYVANTSLGGGTALAINGDVGIGVTNPGAKLEVNGAGKFSGQLDMNSHKVVNVTDPTSAQDAATKNYVDTQGASTGGGWTRDGANTKIYLTNNRYPFGCPMSPVC
jgi:hypothetical protein